MRRRTYILEPGDVLIRGKCRVEIIAITGPRASVRVLRDKHGKAPEHEVKAVRMDYLEDFWEVAA